MIVTMYHRRKMMMMKETKITREVTVTMMYLGKTLRKMIVSIM